MKTWRWIILFLGAGAVAVACGDDKTTSDDDDTGTSTGTSTSTATTTSTGTGTGTTGTATGSATTTSTGTGTGTTGTGTGSATSTGTGTGTGCTADLTMAGSDAACSQCAAQYCCSEAEAFLAAVDQPTYDALKTCAFGSGGEGPCGQQCFFPYCGASIGQVIFAGCPTCVNGSPGCCTEFNACLADGTQACGGDGSTSLGCLGEADPSGAGCCSNTLYAAWDSCKNTSCSSSCSIACQ